MTMLHRLIRLTACSFSLGLLLTACGGQTFDSDSDSSGVQGAGGDGNNASDDPSATDDATEPSGDDGPADEPTDDADDGADDPGSTPTSSEPPASDNPTTEPGPNQPTEPGPNPPTEPGPNQPPAVECPNNCPVIALCKLCDDGSCGTPDVSCNADGSCGATTFVCPEDPAEPTEPVEPSDPADYQPCLAKSCGDECDACAPGLQCLIGAGYCNAEGSCLPLQPQCGGEPSEPVAECKTEKECASLEGCLQCKNGEEWCPHSVCRKGECGTSPNLCPESYEPCGGKEEGEACQNCSPLDPACSETDEIKSCQGGQCMSGVDTR